MRDLKDMTVAEAVRTAKKLSGKTVKDIARRLDVSPGVIMRYLNEDDDYSPRMGMIPGLCLALGNDVLLQWLEVRIRDAQESRREKMLGHVAKMEKAFEGVARHLATEASMTPEDEEEMYDLLATMQGECRALARLLAPARHGLGREGKGPAGAGRTPREQGPERRG